MLKRIVCLCAIVTVFAACAAVAGADPEFKISTLADWQNALASGAVVPVPAADFQAMMDDAGSNWPSNYLNATFLTPELYAMNHEDGHGTTEPALYMRWKDPEKPMVLGNYYAAAWDYVYPLDPDLSKAGTIEFSIHAPERSWNVSVNLIDEDGDYREWVWHVTDPNDPNQPANEVGEIPMCTWTTVTVDPNDLNINTSSNYKLKALFTAHGAGSDGIFELDKIAKIRFDENGRWTDWFAPGQPGFDNGFIWNAWDHVQYNPIPEPGVLSVLGLGLIGLAGVARRRRK